MDSNGQVPFDRKHGYFAKLALRKGSVSLVVPIAAGQTALWGVLYYSFAVLIQPMCEALKWGRAGVTSAFSLSLLVSGLISVPMGRVADCFGARQLLIWGSTLSGGFILLWSQTSSFPVFVGIWIALGFTSAAALQTANVVYVQHLPAEMRRAVVVSSLFTGFAAAIFVPACEWLVSYWGWRHAVMVLGRSASFAVSITPWLYRRGEHQHRAVKKIKRERMLNIGRSCRC